MEILKLKPKAEYVTRQEFDALKLEFDAFKKVTALAISAAGLAINGSPGLPDSNCRTRLEKLSAVADLDSAERAELKSFFKLLDQLSKVESRREFEAAIERARPRRGEDIRPMSWRG